MVLIDELDLALSPRFNVLTGETGAGKSLVVTALDLLLGRRASGELVRLGATEAEVEGLFDISDEPEVRARLEEAGIPADDELLIRRVIPASGRHKCYVNGRLSSLGVLSSLAEGLARVTSQHEQHALTDGGNRLLLLDGYGGLTEAREQMRALHDALQEKREALDALKGRAQDRASRLDYLRYQLEEIDALKPAPGELETLETDIARFRHREQLVAAANQTAEELYEQEGAIFDRLGALADTVEAAARHDATIAPSAEALRDAAALVEDTARFLGKYGRGLDSDPEGLTEMEDRREALTGLLRKHGTDLNGVIALQDTIAKEIATLESYEEALDGAEQSVKDAAAQADAHAVKLSRERKKAGRRLSKAVVSELMDLMFRQAGFEVSLSPTPKGLVSSGRDAVEFLVALNPGEGAHPVSKVASGGELSRLMLAIKRALAGVGPVGTYIFDEVDAGIGGPVASAVGRKLQEVASHHQVICITHLPQIAGMADVHYSVTKDADKGRTKTAVHKLESDQRVEEISRMLAGDQVTETTRAAATELLESSGGR